MFAVGHLSLGYLFAKASARILKVKVNLPLVFLLSLIPDIDLIIPGVVHRTATHSLLLSIIVFLPVLVFYKAKAVPYLAALLQHSLIADFLVGGSYEGGLQLLWPLTSSSYGLPISIFSTTNIALELGSFLFAMVILFTSRDLHTLLVARITNRKSNMYLTVPTLALLIPSLFDYPLRVPGWLLVPHFIYLLLFAFLLIITFLGFSQKSSFS